MLSLSSWAWLWPISHSLLPLFPHPTTENFKGVHWTSPSTTRFPTTTPWGGPSWAAGFRWPDDSFLASWRRLCNWLSQICPLPVLIHPAFPTNSRAEGRAWWRGCFQNFQMVLFVLSWPWAKNRCGVEKPLFLPVLQLFILGMVTLHPFLPLLLPFSLCFWGLDIFPLRQSSCLPIYVLAFLLFPLLIPFLHLRSAILHCHSDQPTSQSACCVVVAAPAGLAPPIFTELWSEKARGKKNSMPPLSPPLLPFTPYYFTSAS